MHFLTLVLFIVSSSLDNFIVGISYGVKKISINFLNNILIAFISGIGTLIAMLLGNAFSICIPENFTKIIGALLLILLSAYLIFDYCKSNKNKSLTHKSSERQHISAIDSYDEILHHPELADKDKSSTIEYKEALILGIALSLNNMGLGIGVSLIGLNPFISSILSALFSLFFIQAGLLIGKKFFSALFQDFSSIISIAIILGLAIYTLIS